MAEILVKAISATHSDPVINQAGCYKQGDPVVVMPDGHLWGAAEGLPTFWVVKVTGASVAELEAYLAAIVEQSIDPDVQKVVRRRRWFIDTAKMPGNIRNQLNSTGTLTVTLAQVQAYLTDKGIV